MKNTMFMLLSLVAFAAFGADRTLEKSFEVGADASFSLDSHKGHIQIRTSDTNTIQVNARIHMGDDYDGKLSDEEILRLIESVDVNFHADEGSVRVSVDYDNANSLFDALMRKNRTMPMIHFEIMLPDDANLQLETHKSTVDVDAPSGRVDIESHKGEGAIRGVRGEFNMETHKGKFQVEILEMHDVSVETHKGDVNLTLHGATDFTVRGETHKGNLNVKGYEFRAKRADDRGDEKVLYQKMGNGSNRIELETHKGAITLDFVN